MKSESSKGGALTPLMRQYNKIKAQYPDIILFFRMGDFYEMFGDDAVKAAPILNIALTSRGNVNGEKIPLAGVPYHAVDKYLARLLAAGEKVVIVEQTEAPRMAKGVVKREVVEVLTPGTAAIEGITDETSPLYLAAVYSNSGKSLGLSYIDLTTGGFFLDEGSREEILERLKALGAREILYPKGDEPNPNYDFLKFFDHRRLTGFEEWNFDSAAAERELSDFFGVGTIDGFGIGGMRVGLAAAGAIYRYLRENNRAKLDHVRKIIPANSGEYMTLDYSAVRNLELIQNLSEGDERDSLFYSINRTSTAGGARKLKERLLRPFLKLPAILRVRQGVKELYQEREKAQAISRVLKNAPDIERLAGRLGMRKINPRQLAALGKGLAIGRSMVELIKDLHSPIYLETARLYPGCSSISEIISRALTDEPPLQTNKGGIIREGFSSELDDLKNSIKEARNYIAGLQKTERERTSIPTLKVGYNRVFGYYIEVTRPHLDKIPPDYIRKQTLVNAERFITQRLKEKEDLIAAAEEKIFALEEKLYNELLDKIAADLEDILSAASIISEIDLLAALANLAAEKMYCCPEIDESGEIEIIGGRHPVIEDILPPGSFISNDLKLSSENERIMILTGPNMSGKSTFLRQIGLIVIMAQIGSFVPAESARIGLVDRVFTRVGAIDRLSRGQSTFLVEMIEASNILHNATSKSLILLDEVGRGTSTFDGLSIAWSVVEYINEEIKSRTIFATHYHELTGLAALYDKIVNYQVAVKRWEDKIIFLHKIIPGGCDDSYGIEAARLAGLPKKTISRSKELLRLLESGKFSQSELARGIHRTINQRSLFETAASPIEEELRRLDIESLTPLEGLKILNDLKEKAGGK
jgi:DNA mismatch repair protein MutS